MDTDEIVQMKLIELAFDPANPRLAEHELTDSTDAELIRVLWNAMDVNELVLSIAASGFFQHEPLIVAREGERNVVIEGNRRLAAVKILRDPKLAKSLNVSIPILAPAEAAALETIPAVRSTRENAWRYIAFKHVNGPQKWDSYAKSRYVAKVHHEFKVDLSDVAKQIGDTHDTARRLYRSLMVIEQAERMELFNRDDRSKKHFSFSHLYTGLGYAGIAKFINLSPDSEEKQDPVPPDKKKELKELLLWLYGSKKDGTPPVVKNQNPHLRQLNAVVTDEKAVSALRNGASLETAYDIYRSSKTSSSKPDFAKTLGDARDLLLKARRIMPASYRGSEELLRTAEQAATVADDLAAEMKGTVDE